MLKTIVKANKRILKIHKDIEDKNVFIPKKKCFNYLKPIDLIEDNNDVILESFNNKLIYLKY